MATIKAFRALRYGDGAGPPGDLVCGTEEPSKEELGRLYAKSPHNLAHIVFPREGRDPIEQARYLAEQWRAEGILAEEDGPGLYICEQSAVHDGVSLRSLQLLCMVRLGGEDVRVCSAPVESAFDPFHLLCATHANFDAMQALVPDPEGALLARLRIATGASPILSFEEEGSSCKVWRAEASEHGRLAELLEGVPLTVTGGGRRYEAAMRYLEHARHLSPATAEEAGWALASLCPAAEGNIHFIPTQLTLRLPAFDEAEFLELCGEFCSIERIPAGELGAAVLGPREPGELGVGVMLRDAAYLLVLRDAGTLEALLPGCETPLPYHMLESLILGRIIGLEDGKSPHFTHLPAKAVAAVEGGDATLAFFVGPVTGGEVLALAGSGDKLPHEAALPYPPAIAGHIMARLEQPE